jgi:hypothetical protein
LRLWGAYCLVLAPLRAKTTAAQKSEVQTVIVQRPRVLSVQSALHVLRGTQKLSYGPILARVHASPLRLGKQSSYRAPWSSNRLFRATQKAGLRIRLEVGLTQRQIDIVIDLSIE